MLPAQFDYIAASSVEEAIAAKAEGGDETRFLAGGQSLLPMMKLRFATPSKLVDINRIASAGLDSIRRHNGQLHIGALVRHADIAASDAVSGAVASAAPWISDPLVRNLGTLCGSVAHCDPEGDWNTVLLATGAEVVVQGPSDRRRSIDIGDFVVDFFTNSLADDEMVLGVHIPVPSGPSGGSYQKLERKVGDYATVGVAAHLELAADGTISAAGVAMTSVAPINRKATDAEALLVGNTPSAELFAEAGAAAAAAADPRDDVRGSARWKRQVVAAFTRRALAAAAEQAQA
ncbi:MAG: xanthine dehydrogenase family protein subunit M [Acidimicrobiaceae bacterium]|nr:xanthine dehydrogenase family protein subunit M [Acidimicrobiaceae bacterium]MYA86227.1 xanthine dehydrogenase family protein subunit M [Acidimicrobiaceae bacterium]MYH78700.1 xanthine dehydrogenase family protein subunit M [Acidimicrobiaceae bacterium]